jgi:CBS domain-containing protein
MKISEIMTPKFETINSTNTLTDAARKMKEFNVGFLPVQEGTSLIGVVTDRDIVIRALAEERDPDSTQVKEIISSDIVYCFEDDNIEDAVRLMEENQVRRLIVCRSDRTPVGIVSLGDIAVRTGEECLSGEALEQISEPAAPSR